MFRRITFFLITNLAIIFVLSIVLSVLGVESYLNEQGTGLDLWNLLVFSAVIGFVGAFISLAMSKWLAVKSTRARVIKRPENEMQKWLLGIIHKQAKIVGIETPEFAIFPSPVMNAFATGARRNKALVAVSQGLLEKMNKNEIEAVIGHEISHIANGDMVTMTLLQGVLNTFVIFFSRIVGYVIDRMIFKNQRGLGVGFYIASFIAQILLSILATVVVMYFSRRREFVADTGGADLAGHTHMIAALKRLGGEAPEPLPEPVTAFGINDKRSRFSALFSSHPPIDERVKALEERAKHLQNVD